MNVRLFGSWRLAIGKCTGIGNCLSNNIYIIRYGFRSEIDAFGGPSVNVLRRFSLLIILNSTLWMFCIFSIFLSLTIYLKHELDLISWPSDVHVNTASFLSVNISNTKKVSFRDILVIDKFTTRKELWVHDFQPSTVSQKRDTRPDNGARVKTAPHGAR